MKLRLLVDSSRQNPAPGELVLLVAEGYGDGSVRYARAKLQYEAPANFIDALPQWKDVPISMKLEQDKQREAKLAEFARKEEARAKSIAEKFAALVS